MNLHQLRFVREAVRQNFNLTEAAKALFTSQPGVSKAIIELEEELGITGPLRRLAKFNASPETAYEHTVVYEMTTDQTPRIDPVEIDAATFHSFAEIEEMLAREPHTFSPCFATLFRWYVSQRGA